MKNDAAKLVAVDDVIEVSDVYDDGADREALLSKAREASGPLSDVAGIRESLSACEGQSELPPCLRLNYQSVSQLYPDQIIVPVKDLDDLIYLLLHVFEGSAKADDYERVLDGLARLCHLRPDDFQSRVSALKLKVDQRLGDQSQPFSLKPFTGVNPLLDLAGVARAWIQGKVTQPGIIKSFLDALGHSAPNRFVSTGAMRFVSERTSSIARIVANRVPLPLLSAPTHKGGWIDPLSLSERIAAWYKVGAKIDKADFIQALLRLAPENREQSLNSVPAGDDEFLNSLRWALGGEMKGAVNTAELWVAAFRCREPSGSSDRLRSRFPDLGPDAADRATYSEQLNDYAKRNPGVFGTSFDHVSAGLPVISSPAAKERPALKWFPTELLHNQSVTWETSNVLELVWPQDRESYFYLHARLMAAYLESQGKYWQGSWDCIFDPDVPVCGMGQWLIALALSAKQPESARLALDALIVSNRWWQRSMRLDVLPVPNRLILAQYFRSRQTFVSG